MINKVGMKGLFTLKVLDRNGRVKVENESPNLIVNAWLSQYCALSNSRQDANNITNAFSQPWSLFNRVKVGTGSATPTLGDTDLQNPLAIANSTAADILQNSYTYDSVSDSFIFTMAKTLSFALGAVVGNVSEIGVFSSSSSTGNSSPLFSRALVVDALGDPTTIPVTAEDQLVITYTLTGVIPRSLSGSFDINGVTYNYEIKRSQGGFDSFFNGVIGFRPGTATSAVMLRDTDVSYPNPTTNLTQAGFTQIGDFVTYPSVANPNTFARKFRLRVPLTQGNFAGGIRCLAFSPSSRYWLMKFDPPIPKTNQDLFELEFATEFVRL